MVKSTPECPKCQRKMEPGHLPDMGYGVVLQSSWSPGIPERRRMFGGIRYDKKMQIPVSAYRCPRCGLVELYAEA